MTGKFSVITDAQSAKVRPIGAIRSPHSTPKSLYANVWKMGDGVLRGWEVGRGELIIKMFINSCLFLPVMIFLGIFCVLK